MINMMDFCMNSWGCRGVLTPMRAKFRVILSEVGLGVDVWRRVILPPLYRLPKLGDK